MAQTDAERMKTYKKKIHKVANERGMDPNLMAGIVSRESRAGNTLQDGWGDWNPDRDAYNAWGLMQVLINTV